jgi:hypothetical protein
VLLGAGGALPVAPCIPACLPRLPGGIARFSLWLSDSSHRVASLTAQQAWPIDRQVDGRADRQTGARADGRTNGQADRWTDGQTRLEQGASWALRTSASSTAMTGMAAGLEVSQDMEAPDASGAMPAPASALASGGGPELRAIAALNAFATNAAATSSCSERAQGHPSKLTRALICRCNLPLWPQIVLHHSKPFAPDD